MEHKCREGYKMTELGEIPQEWDIKTIGSFINSLNAGISVNSEDRPRQLGEYGILKTSAVTYGVWKPEENKVILKEELDRARVSPKRDRIIISRMNTPQMVGASAYIPKDMEDLFLPDRLWQMEPNSNQEVSMKWLFYSISSDKARLLISNIATGTSGSMKNISKPAFLSLPIIVSSYVEQQKIADILSTIDQQIEQTDALIEKTKELKKGLMQRLLTKGIGHTEFKQTEIGEIPVEWNCEKLEIVAWFQEGPGLRKWQFTDEGMKVINVTNLVGDYLDLSNTNRYILINEAESKYKHFLIEEGDIVVASSGNSWGKVSIVLKENLPLLMNTSVIRFKTRDKNILDTQYLYQFLKSHIFRKQIELLITGSAQPNFGPYHLQRTFIPIPEFEEQHKISEILIGSDTQIQRHEDRKKRLSILKKSLMQQLLTGKIRVKV